MLHLLKIEWLKVKNYRTFWVLLVLYLVAIIGLNYMVYTILELNLEESIRKDPTSAFIKMMIGTPPYSFPTVWPMAAYVSSFLFVIPGFLTIILFTNEFTYKTHRQNLIDGYTRNQFISAKMLGILSLTIVATITLGLTALVFGLNGYKPFDSDLALRNLSLAFLQCLSYCMLALMLSTIFKRSGIALGVFFVYVAIFDNVLFHVMNRYVYNTGWFLPAESADNLIPLPIAEEGQKHLVTRPDFNYILISCLIYFSIYIIITFRKFKSDDQ
jgi:ABC-2 type transport system permease protein